MSDILQYIYLKILAKFNRRRIALFFLLLTPATGICGPETEYEEISITLSIPRIGNWEIPALIKGQFAYLPVKDLLDVLQIKNTSLHTDIIEGFFINPADTYVIDKVNNKITYRNRVFTLQPNDLIRAENELYLRTDFFGQIFGLECNFNFRSLSVTINTKLELPAMHEMQLQEMRRNISQLKNDNKADTTITGKLSMFKLGMADWSIVNLKQPGYHYTKVTANIGGILAGGEATMYLNYTSIVPFDLKQQYYRWRFVNNAGNTFKQVTLGNIFVQTTASVYGAISGIQITNTSTTSRRSFGTYRLSNTTEPGWLVELYINNVLVNYTKADAAGFFTFDVPLIYGSTVVKLKFYGPWGEERTREENISIPFNFLPLHQFEYSLTAGIINDVEKNKFSRLNLNYGLGNHVTVGGGVEYLTSVSSGKAMPFVNTSARFGSLIFSAEHTYNVRSKAVINYRLPNSLQLEINYTKYVPGQTAIRSGQSAWNNYLEDKKAVLFMPYHGKRISGFSRLSISQLTVPKLKYTTAELLLSGMYKGINTNLTTSVIYYDPANPLVYVNLAMAVRVLKGTRISPQVQYEYKQKNFSMIKCDLEKNLWNKGFITLGYEKNILTKRYNTSIGIRYNFSFAQTSFSVLKNDIGTSLIQSARGSILYNGESSALTLSDQSNTGRGGLVIIPFLDINDNGKRDADEPKTFGLKMHINGGRMLYNKNDTTTVISGLEAYANYYIELDKGSFENIGWQLSKSTINILIEPNHFKPVEVAVSVVGEASGNVYKDQNGVTGQGRILVNFYDSDSVLVGRTITEQDGYFSYLGLKPGNYKVEIDKAQLAKLNMYSFPSYSSIVIKKNKDGDMIEGLKFSLQAFTGLFKDTDGDGVPDCRDKQLITPASCFPVNAEGVGKCIVE